MIGLTQFLTRYNLFGAGHRGEWGLDKLHSVHWDQIGSSFIFEYYHIDVQKLPTKKLPLFDTPERNENNRIDKEHHGACASIFAGKLA